MLTNKKPQESFFIRYKSFFACIALAISTFIIYFNITGYDFVNFDDDTYVTENPQVQKGISSESITWAFQIHSNINAHWHPLTWLSHMLDYQLFGLDPGMHHLTSLILHIASSILLFLVLYRMTGAYFKSAFVAGLFALHPLNVDSVAWIAERKNVLSTLFLMITLLLYTRYTQKPSLVRYLIALFAFALGILSKPMLATIPFALLLLDYWPLKRFQFDQSKITTNTKKNKKKDKRPKVNSSKLSDMKTALYYLILEKIPFLFLAAVAAYLSSLSTKDILIPTTTVPLQLRMANGLISYIIYIKQMFWPMNLAIFYPFPKTIPLYQPVISGLFLAGITVFIIFLLKRKPFLITGWFWYIGTLVPVIGILQVGLWPATADRWTYIPLIGLFIIIAWGSDDIVKNWHYKKIGLTVLATGFLSFLMISTWSQIRHWENSISLFEHNLEVTPDNSLAHNSLGLAMDEQDMTHEAINHYFQALQLYPEYAKARYNLGNAFFKLKELNESTLHYYEAIRLKPAYAQAHNNLGNALAIQGRIHEALNHYKAALRSNPNLSQSQYNLKRAIYEKEKILKLIDETHYVLKNKPKDYALHYQLGKLYYGAGNYIEAERFFKIAVSINPTSIEALNSLAHLYFNKAEYDNAILFFLKMTKIKPDDPEIYFNLASVYAVKNNVELSLKWLKEAISKGYDKYEIIKAGWNLQNIRKSPYYHDLISGY